MEYDGMIRGSHDRQNDVNLHSIGAPSSYKCIYHLVIFNIAMENHHFEQVNHLFLWAIYTMAMYWPC